MLLPSASPNPPGSMKSFWKSIMMSAARSTGRLYSYGVAATDTVRCDLLTPLARPLGTLPGPRKVRKFAEDATAPNTPPCIAMLHALGPHDTVYMFLGYGIRRRSAQVLAAVAGG